MSTPCVFHFLCLLLPVFSTSFVFHILLSTFCIFHFNTFQSLCLLVLMVCSNVSPIFSIFASCIFNFFYLLPPISFFFHSLFFPFCISFTPCIFHSPYSRRLSLLVSSTNFQNFSFYFFPLCCWLLLFSASCISYSYISRFIRLLFLVSHPLSFVLSIPPIT